MRWVAPPEKKIRNSRATFITRVTWAGIRSVSFSPSGVQIISVVI